MLKMDPEQASREIVARQALLKRFEADDGTYNTGATVIALNADEYVGYVVAMIQQRPYMLVGPVQAVTLAPTGARDYLIHEVKPWSAADFTPVAVLSPAQMIEAIRDVFRLTVSESAQVLRISRPTVYQWERLTDIEAIRAHDDRDRLKQIYRLAQTWSQLSPLSGNWLHATLASGKSVFDLLCEEHINDSVLLQAHKQLQATLQGLRAAEHDRSVAAVKAMKDAFSRLAVNEKQRAKKG